MEKQNKLTLRKLTLYLKSFVVAGMQTGLILIRDQVRVQLILNNRVQVCGFRFEYSELEYY